MPASSWTEKPRNFPAECARFEREWCPWCEAWDYDDINDGLLRGGANIDRYGWPLSVLKCAKCGLIYSRECWTYDGAKLFYAKHYRPLVNAYHGKPEGSTWMDESASHFDAVARVVDGFLVGAFCASGWLDVGGRNEHVGTGPESDGVLWEEGWLTRQWNFVTCLQTFDHLINPQLAWEKFAQAVAPGGHLWVDIVDTNVVLARGEIPWKSDHTLYMTPRTLNMMIPAKFMDVWHGHLPDGLHYGILLKRMDIA